MHTPVLVKELIEILNKDKIETLVDCTFGGGGHSMAALTHSHCKKIIAIDRDINVKIPERLLSFSQQIYFFHDKFSNLNNYSHLFNGKLCFLADLGMSNMQLADPQRSFSYWNSQSPINFSMGPEGKSVYDLLNYCSPEEIALVLRSYGEERYSFPIAQIIVNHRPVQKVGELVHLIRSVTPYGSQTIKDCLSRVFQALRIYSNDELEELSQLLEIVRSYHNCSVCIISFHSLEDRIVKHWMKQYCYKKSIIFPSFQEVSSNAQSRSARIRYGIVK